LPKITVALINGPALAGGFGLALCCDFLIANIDEATFGFTETRIGFIPAIVMNILIRKLPINLAKYLVITAEIISAKEAINKGIVDLGYSKKEFKQKTVEFIKNLLSQNSFRAMIQTKVLFQELVDASIKEGLHLSIQVNAKSRKSDDCIKGLEAFLNKDKLNWLNNS
jgi:methylglutaconyl-CoA hydratase